MIKCAEKCKEYKVTCPNKDCRYWIKYKEDLNCCLISAADGPKTLREVAPRMGLTFVRIQQIEAKALKKIKKMLKFDF